MGEPASDAPPAEKESLGPAQLQKWMKAYDTLVKGQYRREVAPVDEDRPYPVLAEVAQEVEKLRLYVKSLDKAYKDSKQKTDEDRAKVDARNEILKLVMTEQQAIRDIEGRKWKTTAELDKMCAYFVVIIQMEQPTYQLAPLARKNFDLCMMMKLVFNDIFDPAEVEEKSAEISQELKQMREETQKRIAAIPDHEKIEKSLAENGFTWADA